MLRIQAERDQYHLLKRPKVIFHKDCGVNSSGHTVGCIVGIGADFEPA